MNVLHFPYEFLSWEIFFPSIFSVWWINIVIKFVHKYIHKYVLSVSNHPPSQILSNNFWKILLLDIKFKFDSYLVFCIMEFPNSVFTLRIEQVDYWAKFYFLSLFTRILTGSSNILVPSSRNWRHFTSHTGLKLWSSYSSLPSAMITCMHNYDCLVLGT
jgi:hypothetical protein